MMEELRGYLMVELLEREKVITMDADLQDDPEEIPVLLKKLNEGFDLISGWRMNRRDRRVKRYTSRIFNQVASMLTGIKIHDFNCGLKAFRREVVKDIIVYGELHRYIPVIAYWKGYKVGEVKVKHHSRAYGKSKFGVYRVFAGFMDMLTVMFMTKYSKKPLHLFFLIAAPEDAIGAHLNVMAKLSFLMKNEKNRNKLLKAKYKEDLIEVLDSNE